MDKWFNSEIKYAKIIARFAACRNFHLCQRLEYSGTLLTNYTYPLSSFRTLGSYKSLMQLIKTSAECWDLRRDWQRPEIRSQLSKIGTRIFADARWLKRKIARHAGKARNAGNSCQFTDYRLAVSGIRKRPLLTGFLFFILTPASLETQRIFRGNSGTLLTNCINLGSLNNKLIRQFTLFSHPLRLKETIVQRSEIRNQLSVVSCQKLLNCELYSVEEEDFLHPIFQFQTINSFEFFGVVCHQNQSSWSSQSCY